MSFSYRMFFCRYTAGALMALPLGAMAAQPVVQSHSHHEEPRAMAQSDAGTLPAAGHTYRVDFGGGNAFEIAFGHNADMTFTKLQEPNKGQVEKIHYTHKQLRDGLYMVYWQEKDKTTVVHVEDFANGQVYSNITFPDGTFYNGFSTLEKVK